VHLGRYWTFWVRYDKFTLGLNYCNKKGGCVHLCNLSYILVGTLCVMHRCVKKHQNAGIRDPPPPSPSSSSIHPHYLTPSHFFIHPSSSLCTHFFIHPFFHPSIHQHKVPNLLSWNVGHEKSSRTSSQRPCDQNRSLGRENWTGPGMDNFTKSVPDEARRPEPTDRFCRWIKMQNCRVRQTDRRSEFIYKIKNNSQQLHMSHSKFM
jgi:hypothetical protein